GTANNEKARTAQPPKNPIVSAPPLSIQRGIARVASRNGWGDGRGNGPMEMPDRIPRVDLRPTGRTKVRAFPLDGRRNARTRQSPESSGSPTRAVLARTDRPYLPPHGRRSGEPPCSAASRNRAPILHAQMRRVGSWETLVPDLLLALGR